MTNILLTVSYDGTDFCGWQRQDKPSENKKDVVRTVQGVLESSLQRMLKVHIDLQGSGRTDSGVHAHAQAANFVSPYDNIPIEGYVRALNGGLPRDVRVMTASVVPEGFSSRFNATSRTYRYFIKTGSVEAKDMRYVWQIPFKPEVELLNGMAEMLHGEMDCATFRAAGDQSVSTHRFLNQAHFWYENDDTLVFEIEANAFLWKMVRSITGTLIGLSQEDGCIKKFSEIVKSCDRSKAGVTAPPQGLFLWKVSFDGERKHV